MAGLGLHAAKCHNCSGQVARAEEACQASGYLYHTACFKCCSCGRTLKGKAFYNIKGRVYCEEDYNLSGLQVEAYRCKICEHVIKDLVLHTMGSYYHPGCFKCCICDEWLNEAQYTVGKENDIYCIADYHKVYAPKCFSCKQFILPVDGMTETVRVVAMDKHFHVDCYNCEICGIQLTDEPDKRCYPLLDHLLCHNCHLQRIKSSRTCAASNETSSDGELTSVTVDLRPISLDNSHNRRDYESTTQQSQHIRDIGLVSSHSTLYACRDTTPLVSSDVAKLKFVDSAPLNYVIRPHKFRQTSSIKNTLDYTASKDDMLSMTPGYLVSKTAVLCTGGIRPTPPSSNQSRPNVTVDNNKCNSIDIIDSRNKLTLGNSFLTATESVSNYSTSSLRRLSDFTVANSSKVFPAAVKLGIQTRLNAPRTTPIWERVANYSTTSLERRNGTNAINLSTFQPFTGKVLPPREFSQTPPIILGSYSTASLGGRRRRPEANDLLVFNSPNDFTSPGSNT